MKVAYDVTGLEINRSGVARYIRGLRAALREADQVELVELRQPSFPRRPQAVRGLARELWWYPAGLSSSARSNGADLLHCPSNLMPSTTPKLPLVATVFDLLALRHPEWFTRANATHMRLVLRRGLRHAQGVLTASAHTRSELLDAFGFLEPERVVVVPCGVDRIFLPGPAPQPRRPFVLTVGELQPRKNLETAVRAFEILATRHPDHELVIVGARGWHDEALLRRISASPARERIVLAGSVTDDRLVELYRSARCFVFASRAEGFGFPPLEAMACGTPVVSSNATSLPEVVQGAGALVDPDDASGMADQIERILSDSSLAEAMRERGIARAAELTWRQTARQTAAAYERFLSS